MKSTPLPRRIPLTATVGLRRRSGLTRREPVTRPTTRPKRNPMPPDVRALVIDRDGHACRRCGHPLPGGRGGSVHHRIPRGMGGTTWTGIHSPALLVLLCGDGTTGCHGWIESNRAAALRLGWLLTRHLFDIDPADVPLRWDDGELRLYLHHDGTSAVDLPHMPKSKECHH